MKTFLSVSVTLSKVVLGARGGGWGQGRVTRDTLEVNKQIMHDLLDGGVNISHATLLHISAIHAWRAQPFREQVTSLISCAYDAGCALAGVINNYVPFSFSTKCCSELIGNLKHVVYDEDF